MVCSRRAPYASEAASETCKHQREGEQAQSLRADAVQVQWVILRTRQSAPVSALLHFERLPVEEWRLLFLRGYGAIGVDAGALFLRLDQGFGLLFLGWGQLAGAAGCVRPGVGALAIRAGTSNGARGATALATGAQG